MKVYVKKPKKYEKIELRGEYPVTPFSFLSFFTQWKCRPPSLSLGNMPGAEAEAKAAAMDNAVDVWRLNTASRLHMVCTWWEWKCSESNWQTIALDSDDRAVGHSYATRGRVRLPVAPFRQGQASGKPDQTRSIPGRTRYMSPCRCMSRGRRYRFNLRGNAWRGMFPPPFKNQKETGGLFLRLPLQILVYPSVDKRINGCAIFCSFFFQCLIFFWVKPDSQLFLGRQILFLCGILIFFFHSITSFFSKR